MKTSLLLWGLLVLLLVPSPVSAGELVWKPTEASPLLVLSLGDGSIRRTLDLPAGAASLKLGLKKYLLEDERLQLVWKSDGELWMREAKKMPGDETTELVSLPPGRQITVEITTFEGTPVAEIKLRRK
jgi:hypothetical protein